MIDGRWPLWLIGGTQRSSGASLSPATPPTKIVSAPLWWVFSPTSGDMAHPGNLSQFGNAGNLGVFGGRGRPRSLACRLLQGSQRGRLLTSDPSSRQMRVTGILECPRSSLPRCSASARSPSWRPRGHRSHFRQDHRPVGVRQERRRRRAWRSGSAAAPLIRRVRYGSRSKRRGSRYRQVAHVALKASSIDDRRLARSGRSKPCDSRSANSGNMGPSSSC